MTLIFPTVGRKVWFHPSETDQMTRRDQPLDATIVYVWSDRLVNLVVFDANGLMYARTSVRLLQDIDKRPKDGAWAEWMPYQKGQAAKTDELASEVIKKVAVQQAAQEHAKSAVQEVLSPTPLNPKGDGSYEGPDGA